MRKGRGSCVEPSSLKNFGSMFDAEAIHAQIPSNIEPNYHVAQQASPKISQRYTSHEKRVFSKGVYNATITVDC